MKKTLITLLAIAGVASAADTLTFQLPGSAPATTFLNGDGSAVLPLGGNTWGAITSFMANKEYGVYAGCQKSDSNITTNPQNNPWGTNGEGTWVVSDDGTGAITLLGRNGVQGGAFALVLGAEVEAGVQLSSLTFNAEIVTASTLSGNIMLGLAIVDSSGNILASAGGATLAVNAVGTASQELSFEENIVWAEGNKVLAVIDGVQAAPATTAYTVSGISVTGQLVPEPTTATLSLLALAGLAARRRRK